MNNKGIKLAKDYTKEERIELAKRMLPPENAALLQIARETGISDTTLRTWKKEYLYTINGEMPVVTTNKEFSSKEKFLIVMETYSMPEIQLAEYCRLRGLYVEQIKKWRESCMNANGQGHENSKALKEELQEEKKRTKNLEKELSRKEKALAETAALLVLRKKLGAILGDPGEE